MSDDHTSQKKEISEIVNLNDTWILWYHKNKDRDWSIKSYKMIYTFSTIKGFWELYNMFSMDKGKLLIKGKKTPILIKSGNFYLMRKGIFPQFEDKGNKNGGRWSFLFNKNKFLDVWLEYSTRTIGETLIEDMSKISGIEIQINSTYPTGSIKIWFKEKYPTKCPIKDNISNEIDISKGEYKVNKQS
jgi:hypothetical protein